MALLPSIASSNIADRLSKPLPPITHQRIVSLIGDEPTTPTTSVVAPTVGVFPSTVVASASALTATPVSDSVPTLHPNLALTPTLPIVLDTGASLARPLDFSLEIPQASYGLIRSPISVVSKALALASSTPVDPYTLITGEDVSVDSDPIDLSSPDTTTISDLSSFTKVSFDIREFGTATLTFIYSSSELLRVFVEPTQVDWLHWVPLPRLTPTESYYHIFGRDYLQAFALFHLIPIWIALVSALVRSD